jgi:predicted helicase
VLHNPKYLQKYEQNLKREFPRIPFYDDFWQWIKWGNQLMELHINYETVTPYPLNRIDLSVTRGLSPLSESSALPQVKLKADKIKNQIIIDELTVLTNVPLCAWDYKLGNRSALEWILDQYKEKKIKDLAIDEKFNNYKFADYKEEVIDLIMRVTTVSVETISIVNKMKNYKIDLF